MAKRDTQTEKSKGGKPVQWTEKAIKEAFETIIDRMCEGELVSQILKSSERPKTLPSFSTFIGWMEEDEELANLYARAREIQIEIEMDELRKIADTPLEGERTENGTDTAGKNWTKTVKEDMTAHRKLMIDARKWRISKMSSKYGDKMKLQIEDTQRINLIFDLGTPEEDE